MAKKIAERTVTMTLRLTPAEKRKVEYCAGKLGMTNTEVVVNGVELIREVIEKHREKENKGG